MLWPNGTRTRPRLSGEGTAAQSEADFGPRTLGKKFHDGTDFAAYFTRICAILAGEISRVQVWNGQKSMQHGNRVWINHGNGIESSYSHLSTIAVKKGDRVAEGQFLGNMGATGDVTGAHLHIEVRVNGVLVDPVPFITRGIVTPIPVGTPSPSIPLEIIMADRDPFIINHNGNLYSAKILGGMQHLTPGDVDVASGGVKTAGYWNLSDGKPLFDSVPTFDTKGNEAAFQVLIKLCTPPSVDPTVIARAIGVELADDFESLRAQLAALGVDRDLDEAEIGAALSVSLGDEVAAKVASTLAFRLAA